MLRFIKKYIIAFGICSTFFNLQNSFGADQTIFALLSQYKLQLFELKKVAAQEGLKEIDELIFGHLKYIDARLQSVSSYSARDFELYINTLRKDFQYIKNKIPNGSLDKLERPINAVISTTNKFESATATYLVQLKAIPANANTTITGVKPIIQQSELAINGPLDAKLIEANSDLVKTNTSLIRKNAKLTAKVASVNRRLLILKAQQPMVGLKTVTATSLLSVGAVAGWQYFKGNAKTITVIPTRTGNNPVGNQQ